ncbi:hypothetical protein [Ktedonosporobacter rubrisoli]|nr:hypothetical protein [Ktedonosporobacter rubrisoli]
MTHNEYLLLQQVACALPFWIADISRFWHLLLNVLVHTDRSGNIGKGR